MYLRKFCRNLVLSLICTIRYILLPIVLICIFVTVNQTHVSADDITEGLSFLPEYNFTPTQNDPVSITLEQDKTSNATTDKQGTLTTSNDPVSITLEQDKTSNATTDQQGTLTTSNVDNTTGINQSANPQKSQTYPTPEKALWRQMLTLKYQQPVQSPTISNNTQNSEQSSGTPTAHQQSSNPTSDQNTKVVTQNDNIVPTIPTAPVQTTKQTESTEVSKPQNTPSPQAEKADASNKENTYVDNPTSEEIQLAIDSFQDDNDPLFDRYRIRSRNGVADTPNKIFEIKNYSTFFEKGTPITHSHKMNILNLALAKKTTTKFEIDTSVFKQRTFEMFNHCGTTLHLYIVNYMLSKDALTWLEELDDSSIGDLPNYNVKDNIWLSWIWGLIALVIFLSLILVYAIYKIMAWLQAEGYITSSTKQHKNESDYVIPTTSDLYTDVYKAKNVVKPRKNPYGGIDIFEQKIE